MNVKTIAAKVLAETQSGCTHHIGQKTRLSPAQVFRYIHIQHHHSNKWMLLSLTSQLRAWMISGKRPILCAQNFAQSGCANIQMIQLRFPNTFGAWYRE